MNVLTGRSKGSGNRIMGTEKLSPPLRRYDNNNNSSKKHSHCVSSNTLNESSRALLLNSILNSIKKSKYFIYKVSYLGCLSILFERSTFNIDIFSSKFSVENNYYYCINLHILNPQCSVYSL